MLPYGTCPRLRPPPPRPAPALRLVLVPALRPAVLRPDRPASAGAGRERAAPPARVDDAATVLRGPVSGAGSGAGAWSFARPRGRGLGAVAEAAYRAAAALRPASVGDAAVEVCVRTTAGGGRLTVARRTAGGATVGIEAVVA